MEIKRTFDLLDHYAKNYVIEDALAGIKNKKWEKFSTGEYINNSHLFAFGMMELGFEKGDKIATVSNNRPEWNFIDMGLAMSGLVHVPIYPTISDEEYAYIFENSEAKLLIVSDKLLYKKLKPLADKAKNIRDVYIINDVEGIKNWKEILELGETNKEKHKTDLEEIKKSIQIEDLVTIIYTSGTTGNAKGVMLSHNNLVTNFIATSKIQPLRCLAFYLYAMYMNVCSIIIFSI